MLDESAEERMAREPIHAAGGIVMRGGARPRIAVVRRSKDDHWVLPRGKLKREENPIVGARREVVEETGHRVKVHEFLGAISYPARGRPKLVQFWRMQAAERPSHDLTEDITEVRWLPLSVAIRRLSFPLEKLFLRSVGRRALKRRHRKTARRKSAQHTGARKSARSRKKTRRAQPRKKTLARRPCKKRHVRRAVAKYVAKHIAPPAVRHVALPMPAPTIRHTLPPAPPPAPRVIPPPAAGQPDVDASFFRRILGRG